MNEPTFFHLIDNDPASQHHIAQIARQHAIMCHKHASIAEFLADNRRTGPVMLHDNETRSRVPELLRQLARAASWAGVIGFCSAPQVDKVVQAMKAGALSFHEAPRSALELRTILVSSQEEFLRSYELNNRKARAQIDLERLSERERQVLDRLVKGGSNKDIARDLNISHRTVEIHRTNMMGKLGARSAAEAIRLHLDAGIAEKIPALAA